MVIFWERAVPLVFRLCCFGAVLIVGVAFPFGVKDKMWNSIVTVPDHCLFTLNKICLIGPIDKFIIFG